MTDFPVATIRVRVRDAWKLRAIAKGVRVLSMVRLVPERRLVVLARRLADGVRLDMQVGRRRWSKRIGEMRRGDA